MDTDINKNLALVNYWIVEMQEPNKKAFWFSNDIMTREDEDADIEQIHLLIHAAWHEVHEAPVPRILKIAKGRVYVDIKETVYANS